MYRLDKLNLVKNDLHYNWRDIISVPGAALKPKKIFIASISLLAALVVYNIFSYLTLVIEGNSAASIFSNHGLLPNQLLQPEAVAGRLIYYMGILISAFVVLSGMTAVSIIDLENFRGNQFCGAIQAVKFARRRAKQLFTSLLTIGLFVAFIVLLGFIVGLITRIPYLGDLIYSVFFFFPNFIISLLTVVVIFVLMTGIIIMPSAVAADRAGETFNSILGTFSTVIRQPLRWIGYTLYSLVTAKIAGFVFAYFCFRSLQFLRAVTMLGGGDNVSMLINSGVAHLPLNNKLISFTAGLFPGIDFTINFARLGGLPVNMDIASYIMAVSLFLVFLIIWGYIISIIATGQIYAYVIIRKIREGNTVTEEEPLFK